MVRGDLLARRAVLRSLRQHGDKRDSQPEADAILVQRLPALLQRPNWNDPREVEGAVEEMGLRRLHLCHEPQRRLFDEAPPGYRSDAAHGFGSLLHRLRESWDKADMETLFGPVEIDETYIGGKRKNMSKKRREKFQGRGAVGKAAVVGIKDRPTNRIVARVLPDTTKETVAQFILEHVAIGAKSYTDESPIYLWLPNHEAVKHSVYEWVRDQAHTNGVESFWSMLKRGYMGTFHRISKKHLNRYVTEFVRRHNIREEDTIKQMRDVVAGLVSKRLLYDDLIG